MFKTRTLLRITEDSQARCSASTDRVAHGPPALQHGEMPRTTSLSIFENHEIARRELVAPCRDRAEHDHRAGRGPRQF